MNRSEQFWIAAVLIGLLVWQLSSRRAFGVWWWSPIITRQDSPRAYWSLIALQCVLLACVLMTGRMWHVRH